MNRPPATSHRGQLPAPQLKIVIRHSRHHDIRTDDGIEHRSFTDPEDDFIEPLVDTPFLSPVAVLTNRRVLNAAESFVLAMRTLPHVITVGDTTGGGSGNPDERTLPNGWTFALSRWIEFTPDGATFEGVGLAPDFPTWITSEDRERGVDTILELAVTQLRARIAAPQK